MKARRILSMFIAFAICATVCTGFSLASDNDVLRASPTLSGYSSKLTAGQSSGNIKVNYDVMANVEAEELGVYFINIYRASGSYVTTITGTEENGLIDTNSDRHRSSYIYEGVSGTSYYAEVTVFAKIDGVSDHRTITTNTIKAP